MESSMMMSASPNQLNIVLNFSWSVSFRFASAEPIVIKTMAVDIKKTWMKPKKAASGFLTATLKFLQKYFTSGLCEYNMIPITN